MFIIGVIAFLLILFFVLGTWQQHVDQDHTEKTLTELQDAQQRGTNKPLAQYPRIQPALCIGCGSCIQACPEENVLGLVNGIAHVIHGSRCVGHARCQESCPVGAITVGLGNVDQRSDIPVLNHQLETSIAGIFIAGELGGFALIRNAIDQGTKVIDTIAEKLKARSPSSTTDVVDVLIVGAGPAGLASALRAIEKKLTYKIISRDDVGGTIRKYPRRKLTLLQTVDVPLFGRISGREYSKEQIIHLWDGLIQKFRIPIQTGVALNTIKSASPLFETDTSHGVIRSRYVVLALGRRGTPRKLGIPGEQLEKVLYQLIDTSTYNNQHVLIVGGGDSAVEAAIGLANQKGNVVTLSYRQPNFVRLKQRNEQRINEYIQKKRINVVFSSNVKAIEQKSIQLDLPQSQMMQTVQIPNDFVFIFAGGEPPFALLKNIGIRFGGDPLSKAVAT